MEKETRKDAQINLQMSPTLSALQHPLPPTGGEPQVPGDGGASWERRWHRGSWHSPRGGGRGNCFESYSRLRQQGSSLIKGKRLGPGGAGVGGGGQGPLLARLGIGTLQPVLIWGGKETGHI